MEAPLESLTDEVTLLRACLNDLTSAMALPSLWAEGDPLHIVSTLLDAMLGMLPLAFAFVRLDDPDGGAATEIMRVAAALQHIAEPHDIGELLEGSWGDAPKRWPLRARMYIGGIDLAVASAPLGVHGDIGCVVVGSQNAGFPEQTERLVLDVAVNQAAIGLQQARLLANRRRTEEARSELARESRLMVDSIPGLVALLGPTGALELVNRQIVEYSGRPLEELERWGTSDIVHPDDLPRVIEHFTQAISAGRPYEIEQRVRRSDGVYRWFQNNGFPLRNSYGQIVHWYVLLTDIDDRKRVEDALRASERNLKLTVDTIPALAWSARPDGSAEFFNQHYLDFVGLSAEQASHWGWTNAVHPDDLNRLATIWQQVITSQRRGEAEARLRRHDGEYRWFLFRVNPLRDENGDIVRWYGVNTEIEDRKRAEEELRRGEAFLNQAQRLTLTGSLWWKVATGELTWSDESYRLMEYPKTVTPTIERMLERVHPEDLSLVRETVDRSARTGENLDFKYRLLMPDGSVKHVHVVLQNVMGEHGTPQFVGAVQDVTAGKMAQDALNKAGAELAHVSRVTSFSALTASIAHEVNQPLSGIITNAGTCLRMLDATPPNIEGARETARRTIRDGNRASDVIARLRALFTKKDFQLEPLDLNEATREVIALSANDLQRHRVILQAELADDLPIVNGDRIQLQQVILNLLRNALDAMVDVNDRQRHLLITTQREDARRVRLAVRDAGVGIPSHSMDSLFDAFFTTKSGGMGIGLFVSRSIVERHQGRLWAEPNNGSPGTTFLFSIPHGP